MICERYISRKYALLMTVRLAEFFSCAAKREMPRYIHTYTYAHTYILTYYIHACNELNADTAYTYIYIRKRRNFKKINMLIDTYSNVHINGIEPSDIHTVHTYRFGVLFDPLTHPQTHRVVTGSSQRADTYIHTYIHVVS